MNDDLFEDLPVDAQDIANEQLKKMASAYKKQVDPKLYIILANDLKNKSKNVKR